MKNYRHSPYKNVYFEGELSVCLGAILVAAWKYDTLNLQPTTLKGNPRLNVNGINCQSRTLLVTTNSTYSVGHKRFGNKLLQLVFSLKKNHPA